MPIHYTRRLTSRSRTPEADRHLGCVLAAIAGAINAVGFGVLGHYTSHMTGMAATFSERVVATDKLAALAAGLAIAAFVCGAACGRRLVVSGRLDEDRPAPKDTRAG